MPRPPLRLLLLLAAGGLAVGGASAPAASAAPVVTIADKGFAESKVVTQLYGLALQAAGYEVAYRRASGTAAADAAIRAGTIDVYPEYTGTAYQTVLNLPRSLNADKVYATVRDRYAKAGLIALAPAPFTNGNAVACTQAVVDETGARDLAGIRRWAPQLRYAANSEHLTRPDGLSLLARAYGIVWRGLVTTTIGDRYAAIKRGDADCIYAFDTDPQIEAQGLVVLEDRKKQFSGAPYQGFAVIRTAYAEAQPVSFLDTIRKVDAFLTQDNVEELDRQMVIMARSPRTLAAQFLASNGLVTAEFAATITSSVPGGTPKLPEPGATGEAPPGAGATRANVYFTAGEQLAIVPRNLPAGQTAEQTARLTVQALLAGPTPAERKRNIRTIIPRRVKLQGLTVRDGVATVVLSAAFSKGKNQVEVLARIVQVVRTLDQFSYVASVRIRSGDSNGDASWSAGGLKPPPYVPPAGSSTGTPTTPDDIAAIQTRLVDLRYLPTSGVSSTMDYRTQQAVMAFQAWEGLDRDGVVGPATRAKLASATVPRAALVTRARRVELYRGKGVVLLIEGSRVIRAIHTSTGKEGYTTPAGTFSVFRKEIQSWSVPFQVWLPFASYFTGGIAFHAYPDVPAFPASHGCARLPTPEAEVVYDFAVVGTPVVVF